MTISLLDLSDTDADTDREFARIVDELTRRGFLAGGIGAATLLGLAACGSSGEDPKTSLSSAPATRPVQSAYGPVEVPTHPTRVVALSKAAVATLLDVGLTPVGTDDDEAGVALPQYQKTITAIPTVGGYGQFNVEKIAALKPDLVLSFDTYLDKTLYPKVAALAPTVAVKTNEGNIAWQDATTAFADAVNRGTQLAALKKQFDDTITSVAAAYHAQLSGNQWEITQAADAGTFYRYMPSSDPSTILTQLGATLGDAGATGANYWGEAHSYETINAQLAAASVILCVGQGSTPLLAQPTWKDLPATKAGHVYTTDLLFPASYSGGIALLDFIADVCTKLGGGQR